MKKWKTAFFVLLVLNILAAVVIMALLFLPASNQSNQGQIKEGESTAELTVSSNKENLNKLINHYLQQEANADQLNYRVQIDDKVNLIGKIKVFNKEIDAKISFEPIVKKDGNMRLKVEDLSLGQLDIPIYIVLSYINSSYSLPDFVYIDEKNKTIDVALTEIKLKSDLKAKAEAFNLKKDDIRFKLFVPLKNEKKDSSLSF
ncbi:YpmS family protein [Metabacillus sp. GX 13764]|uniref:YpmS family protein n=1 Tax=Metabacillus kandeliae TaxID=2900151 RepID=UPI001E455C10|nr:YpmS family protein [Metabacillus kandeliae]